jgi:hypothetical protein
MPDQDLSRLDLTRIIGDAITEYDVARGRLPRARLLATAPRRTAASTEEPMLMQGDRFSCDAPSTNFGKRSPEDRPVEEYVRRKWVRSRAIGCVAA